MYVRVPAINGVPQVGTRSIFSGVSISSSEAVVHVSGNKLEKGWVEVTEKEFKQYIPEPTEPAEDTEQKLTAEQKLFQLERQNLLILDALADLLAEYPLPEGRKTEADIYAELIEAGRRSIEDVPEVLKEAVRKNNLKSKEV